MAYRGQFRLWTDNQVILGQVAGAWSVGTAERYAAQFKQLATPFSGSPWGHVLLLEAWEMGAPEI